MNRCRSRRKEETHQRILDAAARVIRSRGYEGFGVAEVMNQAGLTHGGFYAHFKSRDALFVEALERASRDIAVEAALVTRQWAGPEISGFRCLVEVYLADRFLSSLDGGCPVAALATEMPRQSGPVRQASVVHVQQLISVVRSTLAASHREAASMVAGSLIGALQLARTLGDNPKGRALLAAARDSLIQLYDTPTQARSAPR